MLKLKDLVFIMLLTAGTLFYCNPSLRAHSADSSPLVGKKSDLLS